MQYILGDTDIGQLGKIFNVLGTPRESSWPMVTALPEYVVFEPREAIPIQQLLPCMCVVPTTPFSLTFLHRPYSQYDVRPLLDLVLQLLVLNPNQRLSAVQALDHEYFHSAPQPTPPNLLALPLLKPNPNKTLREEPTGAMEQNKHMKIIR